MKNIKIVIKEEADNHYSRNKSPSYDFKIIDLLKVNKIKPRSILEIGCGDGKKLNQYKEKLKIKTLYGVDLSSKAINYGKKKYKNIQLLKLSSLDINKINIKFDLIICGFFLYLLDREEVFKQFDLILKKLNKEGFLIIEDWDPSFNHTNISGHNKKLMTFKMNYSNLLEQSGLFKMIYKNRFPIHNSFNKKFKSNDVSIGLYKKIDFIKEYPEDQ